ncbi:hypothetical protein [uncultured Mediterranean phage]|nr:hypothetical protein [uncultured Mediterranean phage]
MPYIGRGPSKSGSFRIIDDISSSFNGSTTAFTLQVSSSNLTVGQEQTLLIALDGVMQEPKSAYTIAGSTITFASAPATGVSFWGVELGDVGGLAETAIDLTSTAITGQTDLGAAPATGDTLLVYDTSASSLKEMTIANLFTSPAIAGGTFSGSFTGTMDITGTVLSGASPLVFEGATADAHETTLAFTDPTADRTITFPDTTGTVSLTGATETLAAKTLTTPTIASTGWTNATHAHAANNSGGTLDAAAIGAGTVATARLGSGTANNTVFLRGDGTWAIAGSPGGSNTQIQYNSSGSFAGSGNLIFDGTSVITLQHTANVSADISRYSNDATAPTIQFLKSKGTSLGSNGALNDVELGSIVFKGNDGNSNEIGAKIVVKSGWANDVNMPNTDFHDVTWSDSIRDSTMAFFTAKGTTLEEKFSVDAHGNWEFGKSEYGTHSSIPQNHTTVGYENTASGYGSEKCLSFRYNTRMNNGHGTPMHKVASLSLADEASDTVPIDNSVGSGEGVYLISREGAPNHAAIFAWAGGLAPIIIAGGAGQWQTSDPANGYFGLYWGGSDYKIKNRIGTTAGFIFYFWH